MIQLKTFAQAVNCIEAGGAAHHYGRQFPLWYKGGILYEYHQYDYQSVRCANLGHYASYKIIDPPLFTKADMDAVDWVCMPKKKWEEYNKKRKADMEATAIRWREENEKQYKKEANTPIETANTVIEPPSATLKYNSWWDWWRGRLG